MEYNRAMDVKGKTRASGGAFGAIGQERAAKMATGSMDACLGGVSLMGSDGKVTHAKGLTGYFKDEASAGAARQAYVEDGDDVTQFQMNTILPGEPGALKTIHSERVVPRSIPAQTLASSARTNHRRDLSRETAITVDTLPEHEGFYPTRHVSPRRGMAAYHAAHHSGGSSNNGSSGIDITITPTNSKSAQMTTPTSNNSAGNAQVAPNTAPNMSTSDEAPMSPSSFVTLDTFAKLFDVHTKEVTGAVNTIQQKHDVDSKEVAGAMFNIQQKHDANRKEVTGTMNTIQQNAQATTQLLAQLQQSQERELSRVNKLVDTQQNQERRLDIETDRLNAFFQRLQIVESKITANALQLHHHLQSPTTPQQFIGYPNPAYTHPGHQGWRPMHAGAQYYGGMQRQMPSMYNLGAVMPLPTPSLTPAGSQMHSPNPNDDVFAPVTRPMIPAPAQFELKGYTELLHSTFVKSEHCARTFVVLGVSMRTPDNDIQRLLKTAAEHLDSMPQATYMLETPKMRTAIIVGIFNRMITDEILSHPILNCFPDPIWAETYLNAWYEEQKIGMSIESSTDYERRKALAENRARIAKVIVQLPGFQQWLKETSQELAKGFLAEVLPLIHESNLPQAEHALFLSVLEAFKIGVRMRQESKEFECLFYRYGGRWNNTAMVQRNEELMGQTCDETPPLYVVRATMAPTVIMKSFQGGQMQSEIIHKGEVLLCDRKTHLR